MCSVSLGCHAVAVHVTGTTRLRNDV